MKYSDPALAFGEDVSTTT